MQKVIVCKNYYLGLKIFIKRNNLTLLRTSFEDKVMCFYK